MYLRLDDTEAEGIAIEGESSSVGAAHMQEAARRLEIAHHMFERRVHQPVCRLFSVSSLFVDACARAMELEEGCEEGRQQCESLTGTQAS